MTISSEQSANNIPDIFCWTKMGTEAGQPLESILKRKELERLAGNGTFAWGIGNSLGTSPTIAKQSSSNGEVDIIFSPMKSAPKIIDVKPAQLVLWLSYHSEGALLDLPMHMMITSRGNGASGMPKRSHYALICKSNDEIRANAEPCTINVKHVKNFASRNPLGASQVTAMVRYEPSERACSKSLYQISFRARMYQEGFVRLGNPVPLTDSLLAAYQALCNTENANDWLLKIADFKAQAQATLDISQKQLSLSAF